MIDKIIFLLILFSATGSGLMAGLFFVFSNTVMKALALLEPRNGITAMQSINRTILNPLFFFVFFGPAVASVMLIIFSLMKNEQPGTVYILLGSLLYLVGCILVTIFFNVPMNKVLDVVDSASDEAATLWADYLTKWTTWNHVRTIACFLGAVSFMLALWET